MSDLKKVIKQKLEAVGFKEISFTEKGKLEGYEFLLSLYFPRTLRTIYFYREDDSTDNIIVEFISMPQKWKGLRIYKNELDDFIHHFIETSNSLEPIGEAALSTWSREKTTANMELSHKSARRFKLYLGHSNYDWYGTLHRSFIFSPFVTNYCFNEAAGEKGVWGAAQYRTWYSASVLNYEGYTITKKIMLYYISGSYIPSAFNSSRIIGKTTGEFNKILPQELPIDVLGAIDTIGFTQIIPPEALLKDILKKNNKNWKAPLEALYFMLDHSEFTKYADRILKSPNAKIKDTVAGRAILWQDAELAKKALKKGISKQMEKKLKTANLI